MTGSLNPTHNLTLIVYPTICQDLLNSNLLNFYYIQWVITEPTMKLC
jgi:hypothetical protein